jgi:two-component system CheB/CheR fusion protein
MSLRALIATELAPYDRGNGTIATIGDEVALTPKAGLALAMALHELASNATKYGALSTAAGRLAVAWKTTGRASDRTLTLTWTESGGPAVQPPARRGFGTTLIERALPHEFDAKVNREFLTGGLRCIFAIPMTREFGEVARGSDVDAEQDGDR